MMNYKAVIGMTLFLAAPFRLFAADSSDCNPCRTLLATAMEMLHRLELPGLEEYIEINGAGSGPELEFVEGKLRKLERAFRKLLQNDRIPTKKQLKKLHKWVNQFSTYADAGYLYTRGSKEDINFVTQLALVQGYVDCARISAPARTNRADVTKKKAVTGNTD